MAITYLNGIRVFHHIRPALRAPVACLFGYGGNAEEIGQPEHEPADQADCAERTPTFLTELSLQFYCQDGETLMVDPLKLVSNTGRAKLDPQLSAAAGERVKDYYVLNESHIWMPKFTAGDGFVRFAFETTIKRRPKASAIRADVVTVTRKRMRLSSILATLKQAGWHYDAIHCVFGRR